MPKTPSRDDLTATYGQARLDDLFAIEDPALRGEAIDAWVAAGEALDASDQVKLGTSDGKELVTDVVVGGKRLVVSHAGRKVKRRLAAQLFEQYGPAGQYVGVDKASGFSPVQWAAFKAANPAVAEALAVSMQHAGHWPDGKPRFMMNHLTHLVEPAEADAGDGGD